MKPAVVRKVLLTALLFLVIANFIKIKPQFDSDDQPFDARNVFIAGQIWLSGQNPYNDSIIKSQWAGYVKTHRLDSHKQPGFPDCGMIYPFVSVPMLLPYYLFPNWELVQRHFVHGFSVLLILVIAVFAGLSFKNYGVKWWHILLLMLAFKSGWVAILLGQPLLLSFAAIMVSWYAYSIGNERVSGLFLGLAMLKVTICLPFIIYFLAHKKWRLLVFSSILPLVSCLVFYAVSKQFYIVDMLSNMATQMQINYAGDVVNSVNTNLTELGILANFYGNVPYAIVSKINAVMLISGFGFLFITYLKKWCNAAQFLGLLVLWNFLFSYHLIYDVMLLVFLIPVVIDFNSTRSKIVMAALVSPLFLPLNGLFKSVNFVQFHLPLTLLALFLYLVYDCYRSYHTQPAV